MKTIVFALALALASNVSAIDIERSVGGQFYVSSYSNAALYNNMNAGQSINIYKFGGPTLFCGVSSWDNPGKLITTGYLSTGAMRFSAWSKNLYIVLCIKSTGYSDNTILAVEYVDKRSAEQNTIDDSDPYLLQQLQDAMIEAAE